jgi:cell division protease FtsH
MVTMMGMSDDVGPISLGQDEQQWFAAPKVSQKTAELIDEEMRRLLEEAHDRAFAILQEKRDLLGQLSALLIAVETIEGEDLMAYVKGTVPIPAPDDARRELAERSAAAAAVQPEAPIIKHAPKPAPYIPPAPPMPAD